jgi:hypothetical protein
MSGDEKIMKLANELIDEIEASGRDTIYEHVPNATKDFGYWIKHLSICNHTEGTLNINCSPNSGRWEIKGRREFDIIE